MNDFQGNMFMRNIRKLEELCLEPLSLSVTAAAEAFFLPVGSRAG